MVGFNQCTGVWMFFAWHLALHGSMDCKELYKKKYASTEVDLVDIIQDSLLIVLQQKLYISASNTASMPESRIRHIRTPRLFRPRPLLHPQLLYTFWCIDFSSGRAWVSDFE